jgi:adenylosuccinate lyase
VAVALASREAVEADAAELDLLDRLAGDPRLGLSRAALAEAVADPLAFAGAARDQVDAVVARVESVVARHAEAAAHRPGEIL